MNNNDFMKTKPVLPLILSMSMPMVISMLVNSLYNIVDSYFVAKISENAMTSLSLVFPVQNFINSIAVGFGVGINAVISYFLGAKKKEQADNAASIGMLFSILHGILMIFICNLIMPSFLGMFTSDKEVIELGLKYSRIVFSFSIFICASLTFEKVFQAVGKMTFTMISLMSGCIVNIILDPVLIFGLGPVKSLGINGAAIATVIGQLTTFLIYVFIYLRKDAGIKFKLRNISFDISIIKKLYAVGIPATLNMALPSVLTSALNAILSSFSGMYVVILGIYYKLQTFLYLPANGLIQGMRPIIGYNYGAGEKTRVKQIYHTTLALNSIIMIFGTIICLIIPGQLMGLFSTSPKTIHAGKTALRIICLGFIISTISVTASGALEGLGMGLKSLVISLLRYVIIIIPSAFILSSFAGVYGVWNSFWIAEVITASFSYIMVRRMFKRMP